MPETIWQPEVERARALIRSSLAEGHGAVVFVAGEPGSGRTALLRELAAQLPGRVLGGSAAEGRYVPWAADASRFARAIDVVESVIGLGAEVTPIVGLIAHVVSFSRAAARLVTTGTTRTTTPTFGGLSEFLRTAAREQPTVCIVDDCDAAPGSWWSHLLFGLVPEINRELPLVLFLSIRDDEASRISTTARDLASEGAVELWRIRSVEPPALTAITGPADANVLNWLHELAEGRIGWALELWRNWLGEGTVERDTDLGPWRFAPGQPAANPSSVLEVVRRKIERTLPPESGSPVEVRKLLAYAALEGRHFTPAAVARAMFLETDQVLSTLALVPGLVREVAAVEPRQFRFLSPVARMALLRYGFNTPEDERRACLKLAKALERTDPAGKPFVVRRIARLYEQAGRPADAARARTLVGDEVPVRVVVELARGILDQNTSEWSPARCRAATAILLEAAERLVAGGLLEEVVGMAAQASTLARRTGSLKDEAEALRIQGLAETHSGLPDAARAHLDRAVALFVELGSREREARARYDRASVDGLAGLVPKALDGLHEALAIWTGLDNASGQLAVHLRIAAIALRVDDRRTRDDALRAAVALSDYADPGQRGRLLEALAYAADDRGETSTAISYFNQAIGHYADIGHSRGEAVARAGLAITLAANGSPAEARPLLELSAADARADGNVVTEAEVRLSLSFLERKAGNHAEADGQLRECIRLYRELGDEKRALRAEAALAASPLP